MCSPAASSQTKSGCSGSCGENCPNRLRSQAPKPAAHEAPTTSAKEPIAPGDSGSAHSARQSVELPSLDRVTTFGNTGKRVVLHPVIAPGRFVKARALVGLLLTALYLALPWIPVGGAPALFLNIAERRFHCFGMTFLTQDLWLGFFLISGLGFGLFLLTALLGRVWCGWACPLTVFLDIVRRLELWIEGDALRLKQLDQGSMDFNATLRRTLKNATLALLAAALAHAFLAYFVSVPDLLHMMHQAPREHLGAFLLVAALSAALWFAFSSFREQFCIVLCPYGRLQSILTDEHTLVIGYDARRGEPRGKKQGQNAPAGDCVDCKKCVQVCPTGIDIRQGLQLECIGCAACLDACETVMAKLRRPAGLIRYDSLAGLKGSPRRFWRPRLALYGTLLLAGLVASSFAISTVRSAVVSFTRLPGAPYYLQDNSVRNQFLLRVFNKRPSENRFQIDLEGETPQGLVFQGDLKESVPAWGEKKSVVVLTIPLQQWHKMAPLFLVVRDESGNVMARKPFTLLGPTSIPRTSLQTSQAPQTPPPTESRG